MAFNLNLLLNRPAHMWAVFVCVNLLWRTLFLIGAQGAYTDGLLQVQSFQYGLSFWPPLYAVMVQVPALLPGIDLELGGRLVSMCFAVLMVYPLGHLTRKLFGSRAAFWCLVVYTLSPVALRWSVQVMTDMTFAFFWVASLCLMMMSLESHRPDWFRGEGEKAKQDNPKVRDQWLLLAVMAGVLGSLTRYQGILLGPVTLLLAIYYWRGNSKRSLKPLLLQVPWLVVPGWILKNPTPVFKHFQQMFERGPGAGSPLETVLNYWVNFEDFALYMPYYITYGVFGFAVFAFARTRWEIIRVRWFTWVSLYLLLALLALQAVFSSFQFRYFLPIVPLVGLYAGHGLAIWQRQCQKRRLRWRFAMLATPALLFSAAMSLAVGVFQGSPFLELKLAADQVGAMELPEGATVVSNEMYGAHEDYGPVKSEYWGRRQIDLFALNPHNGQYIGKPLRQGDVIILNSSYTGSIESMLRIQQTLTAQFNLREIGRYEHTLYPILTDIMAGVPAQNPIALTFRYRPQTFRSVVLQVGELPEPAKVSGDEYIDERPPILIPATNDAATSAIRMLNEERERLMEFRQNLSGGR